MAVIEEFYLKGGWTTNVPLDDFECLQDYIKSYKSRSYGVRLKNEFNSRLKEFPAPEAVPGNF